MVAVLILFLAWKVWFSVVPQIRQQNSVQQCLSYPFLIYFYILFVPLVKVWFEFERSFACVCSFKHTVTLPNPVTWAVWDGLNFVFIISEFSCSIYFIMENIEYSKQMLQCIRVYRRESECIESDRIELGIALNRIGLNHLIFKMNHSWFEAHEREIYTPFFFFSINF